MVTQSLVAAGSSSPLTRAVRYPVLVPYRPDDLQLRELAKLLVEPGAASEVKDWTGVVSRAVDERVAPLLHRRLRREAPLSEPLRLRLRGELYRSAASNELLYRELDRLLATAERLGLAAPVVLKGGALAACLYEEAALRPMSDIDLLVKSEDLASWNEACRELGLAPPGPEMAPGLSARVHYQRAFANDRAVIELHLGLVGGRSDWRAPDVAWFWEHTETFALPGGSDGARARRLDATAHLLYACAHAVLQHGAAQAPLIWLYDLHAIATRWGEALDWAELRERARLHRWSDAVARGLSLSRELFQTPLPAGFTEALEGSEVERHHAARKADPRMSRAELVWREMSCVEPRDRLRWALAILFPSPAYMKWRYPRAKRAWPLLYAYRFGVVLREGFFALAARLRGYTC